MRSGSIPHRAWMIMMVLVTGAVAAVAPVATTAAATYRYQDPNGQWIYTDRPPLQGQAAAGVTARGGSAATPQMSVQARSIDGGVALVAANGCACTVEFAVKAATPTGERTGHAVVPARSEQVLLELAPDDGPSTIRFEYGYVVGEPGAQHRPSQPYRAPFAVARRFMVTQAPPTAITHVDASSRNAIDIDMPVGTAVHAARAGTVINVAARHFRGGLAPQHLDEANFVQVMHDDGTHAIYAHLQLDTVRVRPGQRVARGEYLANSGNTGFSSGPHLHFVVLRNIGMRSESVPVTFAGPAGASVIPTTGQELVAY
jgi:murein DD-endopeptidase MepM/ murein hydrolase activator NlpD